MRPQTLRHASWTPKNSRPLTKTAGQPRLSSRVISCPVIYLTFRPEWRTRHVSRTRGSSRFRHRFAPLELVSIPAGELRIQTASNGSRLKLPPSLYQLATSCHFRFSITTIIDTITFAHNASNQYPTHTTPPAKRRCDPGVTNSPVRINFPPGRCYTQCRSPAQ